MKSRLAIVLLMGFSAKAQVSVLDTIGDLAINHSIVFGKNGLPIISYLRHDTVMIFRCGNPACDSGNGKYIAATGASDLTKMLMGLDGLPVLAYVDWKNKHRPTIFHCGDETCSDTASTYTPLDTFSQGRPALTLGPDGMPVLAYDNGSFKLAKCGNPACSRDNSVSNVDGVGYAGFPDLIIGADGLPFITFATSPGGGEVPNTFPNLFAVKCGNPACTEGNSRIRLDSAGIVSSTTMAITPDGSPSILFNRTKTGQGLFLLRCGNPDCSAINEITLLDGQGGSDAMLLNRDGNPLIAYEENPPQGGVIRLGICAEPACHGFASSQTLYEGPNHAGVTELQLDGDGFPALTYVEEIPHVPGKDYTYKLDFIHCGTPDCRDRAVGIASKPHRGLDRPTRHRGFGLIETRDGNVYDARGRDVVPANRK